MRLGLTCSLPSGEIDTCLRLRADFTVIRDKSVEHSVEVSMTAAADFKLALSSLNTIGEQQELLAGIYRLYGPTRSSKAQVQSAPGQISSHLSELEAV